ncbi:MAG: Splicing factor 3B subunit 6, partial [Marteilia pararefringens]
IKIPTDACRILYVKNLPYKITTDELYEIFGKYGNVHQIRTGNTPETMGTGFVVYSNVMEVYFAIQNLTGFNVCNRYLVCNFYRVTYQKDEKTSQEIIESKKETVRALKEKYNLRTPRA